MNDYSYISIISSEHEGNILLSNGEDTVEVPEIGGKIIEKIQYLNETNQVDKEIYKEYGVKVSSEEFIKDLDSFGFLIDKNQTINNTACFLGEILNKIIFSRCSYLCYLLFLSACIYLFHVKGAHRFFGYSYMFSGSQNTISILVYLLLSWVSVFFHELMHYLTSAGFKVFSKISLGTRLQFLVAQTTIYNPYKLKPSERIKIYISGMLGDYIICAFCMIIIASTNCSLILYISRCVLYIKISAIVWQCLFYMKTDIYFIFTTITKEYNLMNDAQDYKLKDGTESSIIIKWYRCFLTIGRIVTLLYFLVFEFPLIYLLVLKIFNNGVNFDGICSSLLLLSTWIIFIFVLFKTKIAPFLRKKGGS